MAISSSDPAPPGVEPPCEVVRRLPAVSGADTMIYLQIQTSTPCVATPLAAARPTTGDIDAEGRRELLTTTVPPRRAIWSVADQSQFLDPAQQVNPGDVVIITTIDHERVIVTRTGTELITIDTGVDETVQVNPRTVASP